jgi:hypothetical protein
MIGSTFGFVIFFDDKKAIFTTVWKEYNPLVVTLSAAVISVCLIIFYLKLSASIALSEHKNVLTWLAIVVLMLFVFVAAARGSISQRPLQQIDVAGTGHKSLNKCVPNSYYALYFASKEFRNQSSIKLIQKSLSRENLIAALNV